MHAIQKIEEKQRWLDVTNAFLYNSQCRQEMLDIMNEKEAFEKFNVELDDEYQLENTIKKHQTRINQYYSLMRDLEIENNTLEKEMDDLNHLKYISNEIRSCEDEINKYSCTTQSRNNQ